MVQYLIFGIGMMGEAICLDLLNHSNNTKIHVVEISKSRIEEMKNRFSDDLDRLTFRNLSITEDQESIKEILDLVDVAFGAIDYKFNLLLSELCIQKQTHFLDLGGNPDVVSQQYQLHDDAEDAGVTIIPDCGLAPGMVNIIAYSLVSQLDEAYECHLRVGGLPVEPQGILKYQQVFSIRGLTNEYIEDAIVIRDGTKRTVSSLSELETLYFRQPFGEMEAFQTAGGTSSLPRLLEGKITELTYKTIRYPGHMQFFKFLLDYGLLSDEEYNGVSPRELVERKLVENLPEPSRDAVLIRVFVDGKKEGIRKSITWECIDFADEEQNISAMGRTTAYPISILGQFLANNIIQKRGVQPGETIAPFSKFIDELAKRDIHFSKSEETTYQ